jgi:ferric-dicitrate binding protein FerR (iron transport regulator)
VAVSHVRNASAVVRLTLSGGQEAKVSVLGKVEALASGSNALALPKPTLVVDGATLQSVVDEVNLYHPLQPIEVDDPRVARLRITGNFALNDLDTILKTLARQPNIKVTFGSERRPILSWR